MRNKNFGELEELRKRVIDENIEWETGSKHAKTSDSYTGLHKILNDSRRLFIGENRIIDDECNAAGKIYNSSVVNEYKAKTKETVDKTAAIMIHDHKKMIKEFSKKRHDRVTKMLQTPPTEGMKNLLETLKMRDDLDAVELHDIVPMCFGNYHALRTLQCISRQNGITLTVPLQMDCAEMHRTIDLAEKYLLGACDVMFEKNIHAVDYRAFFTTNKDEPEKIYSPEYNEFIDILDYVQQLTDTSVEKTTLNPIEKDKINFLYRDLPADAKIEDILLRTKKVMENHPDMVDVLKLSEYGDYVTTIEHTDSTKGKDN